MGLIKTGTPNLNWTIVLFLLTASIRTVSVAKLLSKGLSLPKATRQNNACVNHGTGEFVNNPSDCRLFYYCGENGVAYEASCPPPMLFNAQTHLCDLAERVDCVAQSVPTGNTGNVENASNGSLDALSYCAGLTQQLNQIVFIGSLTNCHQYYICYYGQALLQECSADLHWNANLGKCDLPSRAACTLGSTSSHIVDGGSGGSAQGSGNSQQNSGSFNHEIDNLINCPNYGEHLFPHMGRCECFVFCVKGQAILQQCPFYYHFDVVSKSCKWQTAALCVRKLHVEFRSANKI